MSLPIKQLTAEKIISTDEIYKLIYDKNNSRKDK